MFTTRGTRLKVNANEIQTKARQLKDTADSQSNIELTKTRETDIKSDSEKGGQLATKAGQLREKASLLHGAAQSLESEAATGQRPLQSLKALAGQLKNEAKKTSGGQDTDSLYGAANELATHNDGVSGLEEKAKNVIAKFELVKQAYDALMKEANEEQKKDPLVTAVETTYKELKDIYDGILNFTKLIKKAEALNGAAGTPSDTELKTLENKPSELATKAQALSEAAKLISDSELGVPAGLLKNAAKKTPGSDTDSLHKKATQLQTSTDYTNATPVIEAFDNVKDKFDALIKQAIENGKLHDSRVQNVISKFDNLKKHYDTMIPFTKIKYYSGEIETKAGNLRSTGGQDEADKIVRYFESMKYAYNQLTEDEQTRVKTQFEALKYVYDLILNVTKMKHYATQVETKAPQIGTSATPSDVKTLIDILKNIYNSITDQGAKNAVKQDWNDLKNVIDGAMKRWKFFWIIIPSIATQCYRTDKELRVAAGGATAGTLRQLAQELHTAAEQLDTEVKKAGQTTDANTDSAAKVLKAKAVRLLGLARELHDKAQSLATAVIGADGDAAKNLATEVGKDEETGGKLREALAQLANQDAANTEELKKKAEAVKTKYDAVKLKFNAVQGQAPTAYTGDKEAKYQAVVEAWDAFNDVYKSEELLKTAVGATEDTGLQGALKELGNHTDATQLPALAKAVKKHYGDNWSGVKAAFNNVKAQADAYEKGNTIKTSQYTQLVGAWINFNNKYHDAIST